MIVCRSKNWEFVLSSDYESADSAYRFSVAEIAIHPHWIARQSKQDPLGDGDKMGVDMALLRLVIQCPMLLQYDSLIKILPTWDRRFLFPVLAI